MRLQAVKGDNTERGQLTVPPCDTLFYTLFHTLSQERPTDCDTLFHALSPFAPVEDLHLCLCVCICMFCFCVSVFVLLCVSVFVCHPMFSSVPMSHCVWHCSPPVEALHGEKLSLLCAHCALPFCSPEHLHQAHDDAEGHVRHHICCSKGKSELHPPPPFMIWKQTWQFLVNSLRWPADGSCYWTTDVSFQLYMYVCPTHHQHHRHHQVHYPPPSSATKIAISNKFNRF